MKKRVKFISQQVEMEYRGNVKFAHRNNLLPKRWRMKIKACGFKYWSWKNFKALYLYGVSIKEPFWANMIH